MSCYLFNRKVVFIVRSSAGKPPHLREAFLTGHLRCDGRIFMIGGVVRLANHIDDPPAPARAPAYNDDGDGDGDGHEPKRESSPSWRTVSWRASPCWV